MYSTQLCIGMYICKSDIIILILKDGARCIYMHCHICQNSASTLCYVANTNNNKRSFYCQPSVNHQYTTAAS